MAKAKKKQKFFDVDMPILNKETQLYGYGLEDFQDRIIKYDLTRLLRGKNVMIKLKVDVDKEKEKATSKPIELKLMPSYLKRMVRKGTNYVEDSFSIEIKDARITVKPFLVTRRKVSRVVRKALREKTKEELTEVFSKKTSEEIFEALLQNGIQKPLSLVLKKIYPLSLCEIRFFRVEEVLEKKKEEEKPDKKEEVKEEAEKEKAEEKPGVEKTPVKKNKKVEAKEEK